MGGFVASLLACQQLVVHWSAPSEEPFQFTNVEWRVPPQINIQLGALESNSPVTQLRYGGAEADFPHFGKSVLGDRVDAATGLRIESEWHACNPSQWGSGLAYNQTNGGVGVLDKETSGGQLFFTVDGADEVAITWVLAGCSNGACSVDIEPLVANHGRMLSVIQDYHSRLRDKFRSGADLPEVEALTKEVGETAVSFLGSEGEVISTAQKDSARWTLQVKAAYRDCYASPTEENAERVIYLMLDEVLSNERFQREVHRALESQGTAALSAPV